MQKAKWSRNNNIQGGKLFVESESQTKYTKYKITLCLVH